MGIQSVEIDVSFTKDNVGVVIHGPRVDNTTDGTGFVSDYTFDELQSLNAAEKYADKYVFCIQLVHNYIQWSLPTTL